MDVYKARLGICLFFLSVILSITNGPADAAPTARTPILAGVPLTAVTASAFPQWFQIIEDRRTHAAARGLVGDPALEEAAANDHLGDLNHVNRTVNDVPYVADQPVENHLNAWAAPYEFLAQGGDCEDYAITKYFALRALGYPPDKLRILFVRDLRLAEYHAVLLVRRGGKHLVLDNQSEEIVPWSGIDHYRPLYSINEEQFWFHPG